MFLQTKKTCLPITKDILDKITNHKPQSLQDLNIDTAFKVAWAGFSRMREFIYTKTKLRNRKLFSETKLTKIDIIFSENNQYVML